MFGCVSRHLFYGNTYLGTKTSSATLLKTLNIVSHKRCSLDRTSSDDKHQSPECLDISLLIASHTRESKGNVWLPFSQRQNHFHNKQSLEKQLTDGLHQLETDPPEAPTAAAKISVINTRGKDFPCFPKSDRI